jgi:hypothetical protein
MYEIEVYNKDLQPCFKFQADTLPTPDFLHGTVDSTATTVIEGSGGVYVTLDGAHIGLVVVTPAPETYRYYKSKESGLKWRWRGEALEVNSYDDPRPNTWAPSVHRRPEDLPEYYPDVFETDEKGNPL